MHYHDFDTGRRIYRALVNRLLAEHGVELRLAPSGPDEGRLAELVDEARGDLLEQALHSPDGRVSERVAHAIAQFRGRIATEHDKRSAVLTLVGILEERRELIATRVGRKDEGRCSPSPTIWLDAAAASSGPVLRKISRGNRALPRPLHPESVNDLVQAAVARAGLRGGPYSAHSLRAGFETYAHLHGTSDRAIAHQTRHRSLATLGMYVRIHEAWKDNAATMLGL